LLSLKDLYFFTKYAEILLLSMKESMKFFSTTIGE